MRCAAILNSTDLDESVRASFLQLRTEETEQNELSAPRARRVYYRGGRLVSPQVPRRGEVPLTPIPPSIDIALDNARNTLPQRSRRAANRRAYEALPQLSPKPEVAGWCVAILVPPGHGVQLQSTSMAWHSTEQHSEPRLRHADMCRGLGPIEVQAGCGQKPSPARERRCFMVRRIERVTAHREKESGEELEWQTGRFADRFAPRRPALDRQDRTATISQVSPVEPVPGTQCNLTQRPGDGCGM